MTKQFFNSTIAEVKNLVADTFDNLTLSKTDAITDCIEKFWKEGVDDISKEFLEQLREEASLVSSTYHNLDEGVQNVGDILDCLSIMRASYKSLQTRAFNVTYETLEELNNYPL